MTPAVQQEALTLLAEVWRLAPEVRLAQLMAHLGFLGEVHVGKGLGDLDDDELIAIMDRHRGELVSRLQGLPALPSQSPSVSVCGSPTVQG